MKSTFFISLLLSFSMYSYSQDYQPKGKRIEKSDVKSVKVVKKSYDVGREESENLESAEYNEKGDLVEIKEWKDSRLSKHEKYEYNSEGDIEFEYSYDSKGNLDKKVEYKYNSKRLLTERIVYYSNGKVKSKRVYTYTYFED